MSGNHASDCALHNMPAMPAGVCDCGAPIDFQERQVIAENAHQLDGGFPRGDDLELLLSIRDMIRQNGRAMGLQESGCGIGVDGADVSFRVGRRAVWVRIGILGDDE